MSVRQDDLEFMSNLSGAVLLRNRRESRVIAWVVLLVTLSFVLWARDAELDQITRGMGKIVPSSKVQVVQNLEGGIVAEILAQPGDLVERDQPVMKIENKVFESNFGESRLKGSELKIRLIRLGAEAGQGKLEFDPELSRLHPELVANEQSLFSTNMSFLENQVQIINQQIVQKRNEIDDAKSRITNLEKSRGLLDQQIAMTKPMVERGIESKTDFLRLERERVSISENIDSARFSIGRFQSAVSELNKKSDDLRISFRTRAQKERNDISAQLSQIEEKQTALKDQVVRTLVRSPVKGVVKQLHVTTIGGVVKPGMDLIDIVPVDDALLIEAQIRPADIAFLHPGQKAMIKVTAYDYSLFGGLDGQVLDISADTMTEPNGQTYFLVRIKTTSTHLGPPGKPLAIIPGMQVSIDIMTGKRTVLDYLLKPFLKAKEEAMRER